MSNVQHSEACCTLPPFTGSDYHPTGKIERIPGIDIHFRYRLSIDSDIDVYTTGHKDAKIAIICIYGISPHNPTIADMT